MKATDSMLQPFRIGVDYYPEHWPEDRWDTDGRIGGGRARRLIRWTIARWQAIGGRKSRVESPTPQEIPPANDFVTLYDSPSPQRLFAYSPGLARFDSGSRKLVY